MEDVARESFKDPRRRKLSNGHVIAQLLEAPLHTPRRSCCGPPSEAPPVPRRVSAADASPQCRHVPFSWESAPGVPKTVAVMVAGGNKDRVVPPPPPGSRCGAGILQCRVSRENTTTNTDWSSDVDEGDGDTFSDALYRTSSSDRLALAALSARLSSIDGVSRRLPSFIMDRFLPAANAIATTSADKPRPRRSSSPRRRSVRHSNHDDEEEAAARGRARQVMVNAPRSFALVREQPKQQLPPLVIDEEKSDETSARVCGLMFFFPWRAKPVLLGFPLSTPRTNRASNASAASVTAPSPPRRSVTLGDVLEKERKLRDGDDPSHRWYEEKSGNEWSGLGWGAGLLGTSKRYCADARKALSRLARSATDGGGSPRLCREQRSSKQQTSESAVGSASNVIPPLSPPSESWLSHARRSNAGSNKR